MTIKKKHSPPVIEPERIIVNEKRVNKTNFKILLLIWFQVKINPIIK